MSEHDQYEIIKPEFRDLVLGNVHLKKISSGHLWTEGPVWFPAHNSLLFSDIPNNCMNRWTLDGHISSFRTPSNHSNGNTCDTNGRLVTCEHGSRSVTRTEHNGSITILATHFDGHSLNSPNDVVVKSDNSIWFTDPTYGIMSDYEGYKSDPEQSANRVYRLDGETLDITAVSEDFSQPNGLAFSKDESRLYIADSGRSHDDTVPTVLRVYDVSPTGTLSNGREFAEIDNGVPDGFRVDDNDNIWCSAADGVHCFSSRGDLLGKIHVPETVSNLCFGGPKRNILFITATSSVYSICVNSASA